MNLKLTIYAIAASFVAGAFIYLKYEWHDKLNNEIEQLTEQLEVTGAELNRCYIQGRKNSVESFIEGVGHVDENISIDLDTLHT